MFLSKTLSLLTRHPWCVALLLLGTTLISAWSATRMQFDFAPQSLFSGQKDLIATADEFKETFGYDDSVIQVILQATGESDVLEPEALDWQVALAHDLDRVPDVVRVESMGSITTRRFRLTGSPGLVRESLVDVPADKDTESEVRHFLDRTHLTEGTLVGTDHRVAAILVFFDPELESLEEMRRIVDGVKTAIQKNPPPEGYRADLTGQSVLRVDIVGNLQNDQRSLIPLAGVLYFIALLLAYRRVSGSLVPLLAVGIGLVWTLGMLAATGQSFNLISNVLPMLLMVLGVSNSVHILSRYTQEVQETPNRRLAVVQTMRHMVVACLLTFLTTAAGFASLATARSDVLRDFGWQAVLGLVLLYLAIVITLTAVLPWLRPPHAATQPADRTISLRRWLGGLATVVNRYPKWIFLGSLLLMGGALFLARDVKINSYTMETYDSSHPTLQTLQLVERRLSGLFPLEIDLQVDDPKRFYQEDFVHKLSEFQRFASEQEEIVFQRSYLDLHAEVEPALRELLLNSPPDAFPDLQRSLDRSQVRMRIAAEDMGYTAFVTTDKKRARVLLKIRDEGTYRTHQLIERLEEKLQKTFPEDSGVKFQLTGDAYIITMAMNRLIRDLMTSLLAASGVIFLIIALLFRSFRVGLLAALPNTTPLLLTLGYMGWRGFDMNAGNVIVFTISLGIAVDDTIHFLFRFREEQERDPDVKRATRAALQGTGPAMVLTSFLIVAGLAVLMFSQFVPTRRFAELLMVTMGGALVGDILLLPACLVLFSGKSKPNPEKPDHGPEETKATEPPASPQTATEEELVTGSLLSFDSQGG